MKKFALFSGLATLSLPLLVLAQQIDQGGYLGSWISNIKNWLSTALVVIMILMTLFFLIQVFRFIAEMDASKMKDRRQAMLNGMIGLFVAVSVWGIIKIAVNVFGIDDQATGNLVCPPGMRPNAVTQTCQYQ